MDREFSKLKNIDSWDVEQVLIKLQRSFNIEFDGDSLKDVDSFKKLSDVIVRKINLEHSDTCTTQHAFYLIRNVITATTGADKCSITPSTKLATVFPREGRIQAMEEIKEGLGFGVDLLQPKQWIIVLFLIILVGSFAGLFYNWLLGSAGILVSIIGFKLAGKFGKEMHLKTVGDLANKISRESYLKARRNNTINRHEIEQKVIELFGNDLNLEPVVLRRTANG